MKKAISVLLALIMVFSLVLPASAKVSFYDIRNQVPVIRISGDGDALYDADNNKVFSFSNLLSEVTSIDNEDGNLYESVANVLQPFLIDGLITGNYEKYYDALQKEIGELFASSCLDNNGDASNGSGISNERKNYMNNCLKTDKKLSKGYYEYNDYWFWYDWRLDPLENADSLHEYVQGIKAVTGSDKVAILSSCLGTEVTMAYVAKYGVDDIQGIGFDGSTVGGAESMSEPISGKFKIDGNAINRFIADSKALGQFDIDDFVVATIDLLTKSGVIDELTGVVKDTIYYTVVEGVTSALALSTFYTWPSYWAGVKSENYETAIKYVFGEEGSKKRTEYAGLIEKIENYNTKVRQKIPQILQSVVDGGANLCIISKYGYQIMPIIESGDVIGDQFASVTCSSFGATTSTVYGTLSDKYIANRVKEGKEKYISPDKQIDASTCLFPDYTWFTKGSSHSNWTTAECRLLYSVITSDKQLTVDDFDIGQFMVYDNDTKVMSTMTEENCDTYFWNADIEDDKPATKDGRLMSFIKSIIRWFILVIKMLSEKISIGGN